MTVRNFLKVFLAVILAVGLFTSCASTKSMYVVDDIPLEGVGGFVIKEFEGEGGRELTSALLSEFRRRRHKSEFLIWDERQYDELVQKGGDLDLIKKQPTAYLSGEVIVYDFSNTEEQYNQLTGKVAKKYKVKEIQEIFKPKGMATVVANFSITDIRTGKNITFKTIDARKANSILTPKPPRLLLLMAVNKVAGSFVRSIKR